MTNLVAIGGGTGLSQLLRGLKWYEELSIVSIVAVTDDGGSSGIIRQDFEIPPPGDVRNNIVALAEKESLITDLLSYRFEEGFLGGHNLGNIILLALTRINGNSFPLAVKSLSDFLNTKGRVLPCSCDMLRLVASFENGDVVFGETSINRHGGKIKEVWLDTVAEPFSETIASLEKADHIVLGPGSLYTSIITNFLVREVKETIKKSGAKLIYISNIMTQPGETENYTLSQHVSQIEYYMGRKIDKIVVNDSSFPSDVLERYKEKNSVPVLQDMCDSRIITGDIAYIINREKPIIRHDSNKLAKIIVS
ncbi:MAG TPA: YvcK family protein, partial [Petrotogaceae bacterium]|nr:YvcK family protein [Petrotogaceae bacterium]